MNSEATPPRPLHLTAAQLAAAYRQQIHDGPAAAAKAAQARLHALLRSTAEAKQAAAVERSASNAQAAPSSNQAQAAQTE